MGVNGQRGDISDAEAEGWCVVYLADGEACNQLYMYLLKSGRSISYPRLRRIWNATQLKLLSWEDAMETIRWEDDG